MAQNQNNKIYTVVLPLAVVTAAVIFFMPTGKKNQTKYVPARNPAAVSDTTVGQTIEREIITETAIKTAKDTGVDSIFERKIRRNIFSLNLTPEREEIPVVKVKGESDLEEKKRPPKKIQAVIQPNFDIKGIMITDNDIKSIVTGNGRILREKDNLEGYIIIKIEKAKVTLVSNDGDMVTVKVWEE